MPREKPYFRDTVADLLEKTNGKMRLTTAEISRLLRCRHETVKEIYTKDNKTISVYELASKLLG